MVSVRIHFEGARETARELRGLDAAWGGDLSAVLAAIAEHWAGVFQRRITRRELDIAPLHPATHKIRRYYGHQGKPPLFRAGDLRDSIRPLAVSATGFEVGTILEYAADVQHGGTVTRGGRRRTLPPRPFLFVDDELTDETVELLSEALLGDAS